VVERREFITLLGGAGHGESGDRRLPSLAAGLFVTFLIVIASARARVDREAEAAFLGALGWSARLAGPGSWKTRRRRRPSGSAASR
jgi:hypothetical protein